MATKYKVNWNLNDGQVLCFSTHISATSADAVAKSRRQMYARRIGIRDCFATCEVLEINVAAKTKRAIIKSQNGDIVQSAFWWIEKDKES